MADVKSCDIRLAEQILKEHQGYFVSKRDGAIIVKIDLGGKTALVWVRGSPITEKSLRVFDSLASKHSYDEAILLKTSDKADYVSFNELKKRFNKITSHIIE